MLVLGFGAFVLFDLLNIFLKQVDVVLRTSKIQEPCSSTWTNHQCIYTAYSIL